MTNFMGKNLKNPIIASSCIATESVPNILKLVDNDIQGVILKSCSEYSRGEYTGKRQFAMGDDGYAYASSPYEKEILTLEECLHIMTRIRNQVDILVIPSFSACSLSPEEWVPACEKLEKSGADGIQLDFFYMGSIIGTAQFSEKIVYLLKELGQNVKVPIMPKLNVNLPKDYIVPLLVEAGVEYVSLLDSVRSPYVEKDGNNYCISKRLDVNMTSCFGGWQLPLTLGYTYTASKYGLKVCAGGGITCAKDVKKLLAAGASTVQSATYLTKNPCGVCELLT